MINTKQTITSAERAERILKLKSEHQPYFDRIGKPNAVFIPKMAYIPSGKDELHVSFFESELKKECDIYTEFVNIQYVSEDPKRTLYLVRYNPFWKDEYEIIVSKSGFERHFIPVNELVPLNDMSDRLKLKSTSYVNTDEIKNVKDNSPKVFEYLKDTLSQRFGYDLLGGKKVSKKINKNVEKTEVFIDQSGDKARLKINTYPGQKITDTADVMDLRKPNVNKQKKNNFQSHHSNLKCAREAKCIHFH